MNSQDYFEKNLTRFAAYAPELADRIRNADPEEFGLTLEESRSGAMTMKAVREGKPLYLHSRYEPAREAEKTVRAADTEAPDMVVIGGFGLGYLPEAALAAWPDAVIVVIEHSPAVMQRAFQARDLAPLFDSGRLDLVVSDRTDDVVPLLEGRATRNTAMLLHRPSADLFPDFYHNLRNVLHSFLNSKEVNLATLARFEDLWTRNLLRNLDLFRTAPGVDRLYGTQKDVPAFVIGAGPSLSKNIGILKEAAKKGVLIAVDTVYRVLLKHGIVPHYVVAVDPQLVNARYFYGTGATETILVSDAAVYPALFRNFHGPVYISAVPFPFAVWFQKLLGEKGALSSGGSVSTTAFDLACRLGCSPITLVGQDLAYSEERIHVPGASGEEQWENSADRLTPVTRNMRGFLKKNRTVRIAGNNPEETVWSDRKFLTFLWWFEQRITRMREGMVRNATEGGAAIRGAEVVALKDILAELPEREILTVPGEPSRPGDAVLVHDAAQVLSVYLETTAVQCGKGVKILDTVLKKKTGLCEEEMRTLDGIDRQIEGDPVHSALLSSTLQRVIHSVDEGYSIEDGQASVDRDNPEDVLKQSRALYVAVEKACGTISGYLKKYLA